MVNPASFSARPAGLRAARVPGRRHLPGQLPDALGRPLKRRPRVPPDPSPRPVPAARARARGPPRPAACGRRPAAGPGPERALSPEATLGGAVGDCLPRRPGQPRDRPGPAVAGGAGRHPQHQTPGPLVQHRQHQLQLRPHPPQKIRVSAHNTILPPDTPETHVDSGTLPIRPEVHTMTYLSVLLGARGAGGDIVGDARAAEACQPVPEPGARASAWSRRMTRWVLATSASVVTAIQSAIARCSAGV